MAAFEERIPNDRMGAVHGPDGRNLFSAGLGEFVLISGEK